LRILGLISGTSHDGIDAATVDFELVDDHLKAKLVAVDSAKYSSELRSRLIDSLPPNQTSFEEVCKLDTEIAEQFAALAKKQFDHGPIDLIASHGQTVFHWVEKNKALGTLQLGQPAWIASLTDTAVLSDLRIADIAAGGQGAPVVPILDLLALAESGQVVASVNLGGIANVTILDGKEIRAAYDTGPASALIDAVVHKYQMHESGYDESGLIAQAGTIDQGLLNVLLADPYYKLQEPKSTGKELFHLEYLERAVGQLEHQISPEDLVATVTELTAVTLSDEINKHKVQKAVFAGGGVHNQTLMTSIQEKTQLQALRIDDYGISADLKEAFAMALIGWLSAHNLPATFPTSTGAKRPVVLGQLTPSSKGFPRFEDVDSLPLGLVIQSEG